MKRLSIGEFSRLTGLSVKALRWYDPVGLLSPVHVDEVTGYRFYHSSQFGRANRIRQFRAALLPLPDIQVVLSGHDKEEARQIMLNHERRLRAEIDRQQRALASLQHLLNPQKEPDMQLEIRRCEPQPFIASRFYFPVDLEDSETREVDHQLMQLLEGLHAIAQKECRSATKLWWLNFPVEDPVQRSGIEQTYVEICLSTGVKVSGATGVVTGTLPRREELVATGQGPFPSGEIHPAVQAIELWLAEHGREAESGYRQVTTFQGENAVEVSVILR